MDLQKIVINKNQMDSPETIESYPFVKTLIESIHRDNTECPEGVFYFQGGKYFYEIQQTGDVNIWKIPFDKDLLENLDSIFSIALRNNVRKRCDSVRGLCHNINSPLTGVGSRLGMLKMYAESLSQAFSTGDMVNAEKFLEKLFRDLDKIENAYEKIKEITNKTPEFSNNEDDHHVGLVNPRQLIEYLLIYYDTDLFFKHKIICQIEAENCCNFLKVAPSDFLEPVVYVVDNCICHFKERDERGELTISMNAEAEFLNITLTNNGMQISSEIEPLIFNSFIGDFKHRSGMGLTMAKRLLRRIGGDIKLVSNVDGCVSFKLSYPRK